MESSLNLDVFHIARTSLERTRGLAYSIYDGLREVSADFYVIADVDGQHSVWDALSMFKISQDTGDVVVGSRFVRGGGMGSLKHYFADNIFLILC